MKLLSFVSILFESCAVVLLLHICHVHHWHLVLLACLRNLLNMCLGGNDEGRSVFCRLRDVVALRQSWVRGVVVIFHQLGGLRLLLQVVSCFASIRLGALSGLFHMVKLCGHHLLADLRQIKI